MSEYNKYDANDLLATAINQQPVDFESIFKDIMVDKIHNVLADKKQEIAQSIFNDSHRDTYYNPEE